MSERIEQALLAIVKAAADQNDRGLIRTALVKYAYLLDVYVAQASNGQPWLGANWRFVHFGPFAGDVADAVEALVRNGALIRTTGEDYGSDSDFSLYTLGRDWDAPTLPKLDLPGPSALELTTSIRKYKNDLPKLLDFVYFHTAPMETAVPGREISFADCRPFDREIYRPVQLQTLSKSMKQKARDALRLSMDRKKAMTAPLFMGEIDDVYLGAMAELDGAPLETGLSGQAVLKL